MSFEDVLTEASLSKILRKTDEARCGILTAFRGNLKARENRARNAEVAGVLKSKGLSYTQVQGNYIEVDEDGNRKHVKELSFFVQNTSLTDKEFDDLLFRLGYKYEQDSVLIIPKGAKNAFLIGTSKTSNWLSYKQKHYVGDATFGTIKTEFYSKIGGRGFEFRSLNEEIHHELIENEPMTNNGRYMKDQVIKRRIKELDELDI